MPYRKAAEILEKLGYIFYMPMQRQLHYWSDRKRWIDVPVLSPYIFLYTSCEERNLLFQSSGCFQFLTLSGRLAIAREEEVDCIKRLCGQQQAIELTSTDIHKGDVVCITEGPFAGLSGYAYQENGNHRFLIRIESLGKFASVEVNSQALQAC